jgi:hypothetical protein
MNAMATADTTPARDIWNIKPETISRHSRQDLH